MTDDRIDFKGFPVKETISDLPFKLSQSEKIFSDAVKEYDPTHIVSMVSGGKDSACSHAVAVELGIKIDFIIHGNTRCGIPQTTEFVKDYYGNLGTDFLVADAGTSYEEYVLRKGFFGKGVDAHGFSYRILKATPFRRTISHNIRKRKRGIRVLLLNGARQDESENRKKNLQVCRVDPSQKNNIWVSLIYNWSQKERDQFLESRQTPINPVAMALCRSGECMCGTMQSDGERLEAEILYPEWGDWLKGLEEEARKLHGFGWGEPFPKKRRTCSTDQFQPMCKDCVLKGGFI